MRVVRPRNLDVVVLTFDGMGAFEFGLTTEVFALARPELGPDWYRFSTAALDRGPLKMTGGVRLVAEGSLRRLERAGTIVIPGWKGPNVEVPERLCEVLRRAHRRGARLVSICSGAFVLAATGLLDGKRATTHWRYAAALEAKYPRVVVDASTLYEDGGALLTSAGSAAGIDLLLHLVRRDFGSAHANLVARRLVVPAHRSGGQAQFIERPVPPRPAGDLSATLEHMRRRLTHPFTLAELARHASMSRRTFLRHFRQSTGRTPKAWLFDERVELAKDLLEERRYSIEEVAQHSGFGTSATLRHHFRERVKLTPTEFRARFQVR